MIQLRELAFRPGVLLPVFLCLRLSALSVTGEDLTPRWNGTELQVSAPRVHFLTGKPLERLKNGAAVPFDFQLTVTSGARNPALLRAVERFVVSYDLWEEKFTVVQLRNARKSGSHLTASAAEAWCLENLVLSTGGIPADRHLWMRMEIRSAESKQAIPVQDESGISMAALIDVFSRPIRNSQEHWMLETGPFRLSDLKR